MADRYYRKNTLTVNSLKFAETLKTFSETVKMLEKSMKDARKKHENRLT